MGAIIDESVDTIAGAEKAVPLLSEDVIEQEIPLTNLQGLWLFDHGTVGQALVYPVPDISGQGNDMTALDGTAPTRQTYGIEGNAWWRSWTDVVYSLRGHIIMVAKSAFEGDEVTDAFPILWGVAPVSGTDSGLPTIFLDYRENDAHANHNRITLIDINATELDVAYRLPAATSPANAWNIIAHTWDGPAGSLKIQTLTDASPVQLDANFTTLNATRVAAGDKIWVGGQRWHPTTNPDVEVQRSLVAIYNDLMSDTLLANTMIEIAKYMYEERSVTVNGYTP